MSCPFWLRNACSPEERSCALEHWGYQGAECPEVSYLAAWLASGHEEEVGCPGPSTF